MALDPIIGASLITAGGSLLQSLFGGKGGKKKKEYQWAYEYDKKSAEDRIARADAAGFKPQTPRYEYWKGLSQIAPFLQNAVMGSFADIFGQDTLAKWGSSYDPMGAGGNAPPQLPPGPSGPPIAPPGGGGGGGMPPEMGRGRPMPPWMTGGGRGERF